MVDDTEAKFEALATSKVEELDPELGEQDEQEIGQIRGQE